MIKTIARLMLASFMVFAGVNHFTNAESFMAQVPLFLPAPELIIYVSGVIEILLGFGLAITKGKNREFFGLALAVFFIIIFPGNISRYLTENPAFGLETDVSRLVRLMFQPVLIAWAIWSTDSWARIKTIR